MPMPREANDPTIDAKGALIDNPWVLVRDADAQSSAIADDALDIIVPLSAWRATGTALRDRKGRTGVWLDAEDDPMDLTASIGELPLIAVNFPAFNDGRGLSLAVLLRTRLNYMGELRAIGEVHQDQLSYMRRCGFTSFTPAAGANIAALRDGLIVMSDYYQGSVLEPEPMFRRRARRRV